MVDNSDFSPSGLTVPSDSPYDKETAPCTGSVRRVTHVWISDIMTRLSIPHRIQVNKRSFIDREFLRKPLLSRAASKEKQGESINPRSSSSSLLRLGAVQKTAEGITTNEQAVMQRSSAFRLPRAADLRPQASLSEPLMRAQRLLVFRARLPLHQSHVLLERRDLPVSPFDGDRLDACLSAGRCRSTSRWH